MRTVETFTRADGSASYRVRFRHGLSRRTGKPTLTSETFDTRKQAERFATLLDALGPQGALDQLYAEDQAADIPTLDDIFGKHLRSLIRVTDGTRTKYRRIYDRVWRGPLGHMQLHQITRHEISEVINDLVQQGLSDKTIANAHGLLAGTFNTAVDDGLIARSPSRGVRLPRSSEHERKEMRFLTLAEFHVLRAAMNEHFHPLIDTLAGTGIRWGEAEALQVKSFDANAGTISITRAAKWDGSKATRTFGPPKTRKGRRVVTLPPETIDTLEQLCAGKARDDLIFTMPRGGQLRHATFHSRYWTPAASVLPEPRPRIHDLRHSHAAWLIAAGVSLPVIQARLGHESIVTTVDVYGHLAPETQAAAATAASLVFQSAPLALGT